MIEGTTCTVALKMQWIYRMKKKKKQQFIRISRILNRLLDQQFHKVRKIRSNRIKNWEVKNLLKPIQINIMKMVKRFQLFPRMHSSPIVILKELKVRIKQFQFNINKNLKVLFKMIMLLLKLKKFQMFQAKKIETNKSILWKMNLLAAS